MYGTSLICFLTHETQDLLKCFHPQRHLQATNITEANQECTEQEIK